MRRSWISWVIAVLLVLAGLCLLGFIALPYSTLKSLTDSFMPDHNFNSLKLWNTTVFKIIFGVGGTVFLGLATLTAFRRWNWIIRIWKRLWLDARRSFGLLRLYKQDLGFLVGVLAITFVAVVFRMERANAPMVHDQAYTYVAFSRSLFSALTDYPKPNNHVLHSILVYFSTRIFGLDAWAVRLPAFLAGVLLEPASYWLAAGLGTAVLTLLFYTPILVFTNPKNSYANDMLAQVPWKDLLVNLSARISDTWSEWTLCVPTAVLVLLGIGCVLSLVLHLKLAKARTPLQVAALLWFTALLLNERPNAEPRFWSFLMPLILI